MSKGINIFDNEKEICKECNYSFDYKENKVDIDYSLSQIRIRTNYEESYFPATYNNSLKLRIMDMFITLKPGVTYNNKRADAYISIEHLGKISETELGVLVVSIPIVIQKKKSILGESNGSKLLTKLIDNALIIDPKTKKISVENISLNDLIPMKKYYIYKGIDIDEKNKNFNMILFSIDDNANIDITQETYDKLLKALNIKDVNKEISLIKTDNVRLFVNPDGPTFTGGGISSITSGIGSIFSGTSQTSSSNTSKTDSKNNPVNWLGFLISVLTSILYIALWAIIGSNILYFLHVDDLDPIFPSDTKKVPYSVGNISQMITLLKNIKNDTKKTFKNEINETSGKNISGNENISSNLNVESNNSINNNMTGGNNENNENIETTQNNTNNDISNEQEDIDYYKLIHESVNNQEKIDKIKRIFKLDREGFPYTYSNTGFGIKNTFKNFIGDSAKYSYSTGRGFIKTTLNAIKESGNIGYIVMFILMPLILFLLMFIVPIIGYILTLIGEINSGSLGLLTTFFFSFVFGLSFMWPGIVSLIQTVQFLCTFLFLPIFIDFQSIKFILKDNSKLLINILIIMIMVSAPTYLGMAYGGPIITALAVILMYIDFKDLLLLFLNIFID